MEMQTKIERVPQKSRLANKSFAITSSGMVIRSVLMIWEKA